MKSVVDKQFSGKFSYENSSEINVFCVFYFWNEPLGECGEKNPEIQGRR